MQTKPLARPFGFRRAACVVALALAFPSAAVSAPAPPAFLSAWEQSDRLLAGNDLAGSVGAIEPLLAQRDQLDAGSAERAWFDYSAARVLQLVNRTPEAEAFVADLNQTIQVWVDRGRAIDWPNRTASPYWDARLDSIAAPLDGPQTFVRAFLQVHLGTPADRDVRCTQGAANPSGTSIRVGTVGFPSATTWLGAGEVRDLWVENLLHDSIADKLDYGRGLVVLTRSYFGGVNTDLIQPKDRARALLCNLLPVRVAGAPSSTFFTSFLPGQKLIYANARSAASIPSTEPIITTRRVAPGAQFAAQVFAPDATTARVDWIPIKKRAKKVTTKATISGNVVSLRAPSRRGQYSPVLKLRASDSRGKRQWLEATDIYGVGVGTAPARYPTYKNLSSQAGR